LPGWPSLFLAGGGGHSRFFTTGQAPWQHDIGLSGALHKPDIAALAGRPYSVGGSLGTSAASPLMAGAIAVLHGYLATHHAKPVGELNPLLYRIAARPTLYRKVFHDVTRGNNDLLGLGCCRARRGYDEASGLGSLDIAALAHVLLTDPGLRRP
jgi:kumamolisin